MGDIRGIPYIDELKLKSDMDTITLSNTYAEPCDEKDSLKLVVFNVERGKYLDEIEEYIKYHPSLKDPDIIFFNEMDDGMARTGNIDVTAELSKRLSMNYIYGVEFFEITKGNLRDKTAAQDNKNTKGFHGNAILSRYELLEPMIFRLPMAYDWFYDEQKRLGGRNALFAKIRVNNRLIGLVCTHLENRTSPLKRKEQMEFILKHAKEYFNDMPVIIAGDMNTNTCDGNNEVEFLNFYENRLSQTDRVDSPEKYEPILQFVEDEGFDYKGANVERKITRRKPFVGKGSLDLNLDWFFVKGLKCVEPAVIKTIYTFEELEGISLADAKGKEGLEFSDHNAISVKCLMGI